ncbi:MAG TPA: tRNA (cytidine(34)-2'-O)-methyltransferase [Gemmatimonadales bacterium]|nr:tRNA (cytidine(34)-2'-O)-methyltransferase [Gemmatimonadales bacterium]
MPGERCTREEGSLLHIALIEPKIPPNTGNIARLCAATDTSLHLIEPLGFQVDDAQLKRAGLDYWDAVDLWLHPGWRSFRDAMSRERCLYFSAKATRPLDEAPFQHNSVLIFGNEVDGMPDRILEKYPDRCYTIPMQSGRVRSLNLATAAGIVLYEALRRLGSEEAANRAAELNEEADDPPMPADSAGPRLKPPPRPSRPSRPPRPAGGGRPRRPPRRS